MNDETTFVTCLIKIYEEEPYEEKNIDWRIEHFREIANTGIKICVYGCPKYNKILTSLENEFPDNVKIMNLKYNETKIYELCSKSELTLPEYLHETKDTFEYMRLMNLKIEFVNDAIIENTWNSTNFAWMDFSISYLFKNKEETLKKMKQISKWNYGVEKDYMFFPGCWNRIPENNPDKILNNIHWRFCGSFFIGNKNSLKYFYQKYLEEFAKFIDKYGKLVWEVNFWAWMEANTDCKMIWISSDHNDKIINIPQYSLPEYKIFSVGYRCSTAGILKQMGLKTESYPFDWLISRTNVIKHCIENNFVEFMNLNNYEQRNTKTYNNKDTENKGFVCEENIIFNRFYQDENKMDEINTYQYNLAMNHHNILEEKENQYYRRCIERFQSLLCLNEPKMFVHITPLIVKDIEYNIQYYLDECIDFYNFMKKQNNSHHHDDKEQQYIIGSFYIIVKDLLETRPKMNIIYENYEQYSKCRIYVLYANIDFIDAGETFMGNYDEEEEMIKNTILRFSVIEPKSPYI